MKLEGSVPANTTPDADAEVNQNLLKIRYLVRGPLVQRAELIEKELCKGVPKPFERVVRANIGDFQALGQKPITFLRQVMSVAAWPSLADTGAVPDDVCERARLLLDDCKCQSAGSYSPPRGLRVVLEHAAQFLARRDAAPASCGDLYLGAGATDLIVAVLELFAQHVNGKPPAVLLPVPQYPVFSGALAELNIARADYFLDEETGWSISSEELERALRAAEETSHVRAIVVINPGNPSAQVLSRENIEEIIKFAHKNKLFILADEVYQDNIVVEKPFYSFKKVLYEMGPEYSSVELASFITLSKGWSGECGLRAALCELRGVSETARRALDATRALRQCPNILGQCALDVVMKPPVPGEPSYEQYTSERAAHHRLLTRRARDATEAFNSIPGYSCNPIEAALFAFPRVELPARAQAAAAAGDMAPDEFYCWRLLEETGVCVVPGSGFGQAPDSFHFRTTILHSDEEFHHIISSIRRFHTNFLEQYS